MGCSLVLMMYKSTNQPTLVTSFDKKGIKIIVLLPPMDKYSHIFETIDEKTVELLECAYNDFMGLNQNFKGIAKNARRFIEMTSEIQNSLHNICNESNIDKFKQLETSLLKTSYPDHQIIEINENLKHIINNTNDLKILFKNLNQDLLTVRFLIANCQISDSFNSTIKDETFELWINRINQYRQTENNNFQKLNIIVNDVQELIDKIAYLNQPLFDVHNVINIGIGIIANKKSQFNQHQQTIDIDIENISSCIADIITNLQYHDIIKQKIEHVCLSQNKIKNDAYSVNGDCTAEEKFLSEVKELVSIQSAILVRANQEYQQAIENIMNKFKSICENISHIWLISNGVLNSKVGDIVLEPMNFFSKLYESCTTIKHVFKDEDKTFEKLVETASFIENTNNKIYEQLQTTNIAEARQILGTTRSSVSQQIVQVLDGIETTSAKIEELCKKNQLVTKYLGEVCSMYNQIRENGSIRKNITRLYLSLINSIEQDINKIKELHSACSVINQSIITDVTGIVESMKYYEIFEHKIVVITNKLNDIFAEVRGQTSPQKLESIRKMYTMQSEHNIHTNIIEGKTNEAPQPLDEEVGDVELF